MDTINATPAPQTTPATGAAQPEAAAAGVSMVSLRRRLPYLVCVLLACIMMFANYVVAMPLSLIPGISSLAERSPALGAGFNAVFCLVTLATALVVVMLAARWVLGARLGRIGWVFTRASLPMFLVGWAVAAGVLVLGQVITPMLGFNERHPVSAEDWAKITAGAVVASVMAKVAQGIALQGIPEELVWRGWLMHCLEERPRLSLAVSAVVFGMLHFISNGGQQNLAERFIYIGQAMAFAFVGGALALRLRSMWAAIGVHGGMHLTNLALSFTALNGAGPANWVFTSVCWTVIGLVMLFGWRGDRVVFDR